MAGFWLERPFYGPSFVGCRVILAASCRLQRKIASAFHGTGAVMDQQSRPDLISEVPDDENRRLDALRACAVLDGQPESTFDDLTTLAGQLCSAPIALISLVDQSRQWFISRVGTDLTEIGNEYSFCVHSIGHGDELFEVEDARLDSRFRDNPLVTGTLGVRFYAGVPLTLRDGLRLGTLCVLDRSPRSLTQSQSTALRTLARQVVAHLELRRTAGELASLNARLAAESKRYSTLEQIHKSSARLMGETIDAMQENIAVVDDAGLISYVNRSWKQFAAANGANVSSLSVNVGADYLGVCRRSAQRGCQAAQDVGNALQAALKGQLEPGFSLEYPCHSPSEQRWFAVQISSFGDDQRRFAVVCHKNVTQRHLAEEGVRKLNAVLEERVHERTIELADSNQAMRTSEARFRSLFEDASVGMVRVGPDGLIKDVNQAYCVFTGRSAAQLFATAIGELVAGPEADRLERLSHMMFTGTVPGFELELCYVNSGVSPVWARASVTAVRNAAGEVESALFLVQNLTRSKSAEFERDRFFELAVDMIVLIGFDRKVHRANPACTRILGFSEKELMEMPIDELIHPDDRQRSTAAIARSVIGPPGPLLDVRVRTRSGAYRHTRWSSSPGLHQEQMIAVGRDITQLRQAELAAQSSARQLRALAARLQRIREEERTVISREIHDELGQMLTALKMDLTLLRRDSSVAGWEPDAQRLVSDLSAMDELVDATLRSVRRIARQLRPEALDALGLVAALEWQASEINSRTGPRCEVIADGDFPDLDPDCNTALFRIVQEALTNVVRHADAAQVKIIVSEANGQVSLSISDDGRGFKGDQPSDSPSLGLLGMRERAMEIGAHFQVDSRPGEGTLITVKLPLPSVPARAP